MSERANGTMVFCVAAFLVGLIESFFAFQTTVGLAAGDQRESPAFQASPDDPLRVHEALQEMRDELAAAAAGVRTLNWALVVCHFSLSLIMIVGAILACYRNSLGPSLLLLAFAAALLFVPAHAVLDSKIISEDYRIIEKAMQRIGPEPRRPGIGQPPEWEPLMGGFTRGAMTRQLFRLLGTALARWMFYLFGVWYLTQPAVIARFTRRPF